MQPFEKSDLASVLSLHKGNTIFRAVLMGLKDASALLNVLARYIHFNSVFGGGVANLAGEIAVRQDLFRDLTDPLLITADRSAEVASCIFYAAIDEFDDRGTAYLDTHRTLAQATLKGAGQFFGYTPHALGDIVFINGATLNAMDEVRIGYGVGLPMDEKNLFFAMGFHMGSEVLADEEFNILDAFLRKQYADLVHYLESTYVKINKEKHLAHYWIRIHTSVEADHFVYAARGVNKALQYYAGESSEEDIRAEILRGFRTFSDTQSSFMQALPTGFYTEF